MESRSDRLRAFCSITIDDSFVVHDLRVIEGRKGRFVAMPSRKLSDNCPKCNAKNHLRSKFCCECGARLDEDRAVSGPKAREKFHVDVAHPISTSCREIVQYTVLAAFEEEALAREQEREPKRIYREDELQMLVEKFKDQIVLSDEAMRSDYDDVSPYEETTGKEPGASVAESERQPPADQTGAVSPPEQAAEDVPQDVPEDAAQEAENEGFGKGIF